MAHQSVLYSPSTDAPTADVVDLADAGRVLRRGWRTIAACAVVGLLVAGGVLLWAPRRFDGTASVVLKAASDPGSSLLGRLGIPADIAPTALAGSLKSPVETELAVLQSNAVLGAVIDSLGLQARVLEPRGAAPWQLLRPASFAPAFKKRTLHFTRTANGYHVSGPRVEGDLRPGAALQIDVGTLRLADGPLPPAFAVELLDREDALKRMMERVSVEKAGGEVISIGYAAPDSLSASAVPNAIVGTYLARRRTVDRGVNQTRAEFLAVQLDSVNRQLTAAEQAMRAFQEGAGGVIDPELVGKLELEASAKADENLAATQVEARALDSLMQRLAAGHATAREITAFPSFLKSPGMNEILSQLTKLETDRTRLLERLTETSPEIVALNRSIKELEQQLTPLGRTYLSSLNEQQRELQRQLAKRETMIAALPASAQRYVRLQRDVRRLSETSIALQTQLLAARLATIGEGGEARPLDVALSPKKPAFPRPIPTTLGGFGGGLAIGVLGVLLAGFLSPRIGGTADVTRLVGLPAAYLGRGSATFHAVCRSHAGLAIAPLDASVDGAAVARWLAGDIGVTRDAPHRRVAPQPARALAAVAADGSDVVPLTYGDPTAPHAIDRAPNGMPPVLPPLATPEGAAAVSMSGGVVLAAPSSADRQALADAVVAIRLAGAEPLAVVLT